MAGQGGAAVRAPASAASCEAVGVSTAVAFLAALTDDAGAARLPAKAKERSTQLDSRARGNGRRRAGNCNLGVTWSCSAPKALMPSDDDVLERLARRCAGTWSSLEARRDDSNASAAAVAAAVASA